MYSCEIPSANIKSNVALCFNHIQELKKLQEQFGTKPSPIRPLPARKPLSNVNMGGGTPTNRRVSTPMSRKGGLSSSKVKEAVKIAVAPANYGVLSKDSDNFPFEV